MESRTKKKRRDEKRREERRALRSRETAEGARQQPVRTRLAAPLSAGDGIVASKRVGAEKKNKNNEKNNKKKKKKMGFPKAALQNKRAAKQNERIGE